MSQPVKLSDALVLDARMAGETQQRSIAGQVEFWARLGRSLDELLEGRAKRALRESGERRLLSELISTLDAPEGKARLKAYLDSRPFPHFEPHPSRKGFLVRIEQDGTRSVGRFVNRQFVVNQGVEAEIPSKSPTVGVKTNSILSESAEWIPAVAASDRPSELIEKSPNTLEVSRRVRLIAPQTTPVLIQGPTGSGRELIAAAIHRLSPRSRKPFVAVNCAAIPEALSESALFGRTRGALASTQQERIGLIEAADGGTLFLDEIGEVPPELQAKLLRLIDCGELQRVGDTKTVKVDVRIVAATERSLAEYACAGRFLSNLYYRLAVFLIKAPSLAEHTKDLPVLLEK